MEAVLLPDEHTDYVATNRLGHGWAMGIPVTGQSVTRKRQPAVNPLSHMAETGMLFYDIIDIVCLALVHQNFVKIKEYSKIIIDRTRNLK